MKNRCQNLFRDLKRKKKFLLITPLEAIYRLTMSKSSEVYQRNIISLTLNEKSNVEENKDDKLSLGAQLTLERIKKGNVFNP